MKVERGRFDQFSLFAIGDGLRTAGQAAGASKTDLEKHQRVAITADQVDLAAAIEDIALDNGDPTTLQVAGSDRLGVGANGVAVGFAIHGGKIL